MSRASAWLIGAALAAALCAPATTAARADTVPQGTATKLPGTFPNYWWDYRNDPKAIGQADMSQRDTASVSAFADTANHRVFEYNNFDECPSMVAYDSTTSALLATNGTAPGCPMFAGGTNSKSIVSAVDPVDHVIFAADQGSNTIYAMSEDLKTLVIVPAPASSVNARPGGLSWYAPLNQLIVERDNQTNALVEPPTGVVLETYGVQDLLHGRTQPQFTYTVPGCQTALNTFFATADPYRSNDGRFVHVPCQITGSSDSDIDSRGVRTGVVRVEMGSKDASGIACPGGCPDGQTALAPSPGLTEDFLYDPQSDRGFMPNSQTNGSSPGVSLLVYDGRSATFLGRARVGGTNDQQGLAMAQDLVTGRIYALGNDGLTVVDGRRTPVAPGVQFQQYAATTSYATFPVLPPDSQHAYSRVPMGFVQKAPSTCVKCIVRDFVVFADTLPAAVDPPASAIDVNTHKGPILPGSSVSTVYGGSARGYGFHSDLVGGIQAIVDNLSPNSVGGNLPFSKGSLDLLGAEVSRLTLRDGASDGDASALGDGNGAAGRAFGNCTDPASLSACAPALPSARLPRSTTQGWPYPDAQCSRPGQSSGLRSESAGAYATTSYSANGSPVQTAIPGSSAVADAAVDCAATTPASGATATATLRGGGAAVSGGPAFGVAESSVVASVAPPRAPTGVVSSIVASARGIHIDLGGGAGIDIGNVTQTARVTAAGLAGSAHGTLNVTMADVSMSQGGTTTVLCAGACTGTLQSVADRLNSAFPFLLHVVLPTPDDRYFNACTSTGGTTQCMGSPGGYIAAVQASLVQQYSDQQFNGMSAEEAAFLPALRLVVFGANDGAPNISRQIIDLAGVDIDSELGLDVLPPAIPSTVVLPLTNIPLPSIFLPPPPAPPAKHPHHPAPGTQQQVISIIAPSSVVERTLNGLNWMARSPGDALEMAAFLGLLLLPFLLMDRRRVAIRDILGGSR